MGLKNCKTIRILVALAIAAALFGCGKGSDRPASGWFSENDDMASAIADTGAFESFDRCAHGRHRHRQQSG